MKKPEKNGFIKQIRKMNLQNDKSEEKAFNKIIENLYIKNLWGKKKAMGLDEYDSEKFTKITMVPGHIYMFRYNASKSSVYDNGDIHFEYFDSLPILLCMSYTNKTVSGINLNFCNYALRTLILNDIYNLDPWFFQHEASVQAHKEQMPLSKNISAFFLNKENITLFLKRIVQKYNIDNYDLIYRTYNVNNIKTVRFIEPWQWQYIPFVNYKQNIKTNILQLIQHITHIDKVKI